MTKEELIKELKGSTLFAECPTCHKEFMLRDALLFDGLGAFPKEARSKQSQLKADFKTQKEELAKSKIRAAGSEQVAIAVGFGKILEKIAPAHKDFGIALRDCRPLFEPIDIIAFNGLSTGKINSVTFCEIKTGKAKLVPRERMVKKAIDDGKVGFQVIQ